jgi:hypothetical protein
MDYNIDDHTITLPDGTTVPTEEACRRYRINIPMVELYQGAHRSPDPHTQPYIITVPCLLTDAIPGAHNDDDGYSIDRDTMADAYDALCDDIAERIGQDIAGDRFDRLWASFRRDVCRARGDSADRYAVHSRRYYAQHASCYTDTDERGLGYVHIADGSADLEPQQARRYAAAILAAADEAEHL